MRGAIEQQELIRVDVAEGSDQQHLIVEGCANRGAERPGPEFLDASHQRSDIAVRVIDQRVAVVVLHADQAAIPADDGTFDIDQGVRKYELRLLLIRQIDEPDSSTAFGRAEGVGKIRIVSADGDGLEMIFPAEQLEFAQTAPIRFAIEMRPIRDRSSDLTRTDSHLTTLIGNPA